MATFVSAIICTVALVCTPMTVQVVDGDSLKLGQERIRVRGYDAPEMDGNCARERRLARLAKARLADLVDDGPLIIEPDGLDKFGRTLADVSVSSKNVGETLHAEGLMQIWKGRKAEWCK